METLKIAILGSTKGTDMQAIIDAIAVGDVDASIEVVVSNKESAFILERAEKHSIETRFLDASVYARRDLYDDALDSVLKKYDVDLVLLIGWMRILSAGFVRRWEKKIVNIHPSLLPAFSGGMDMDVHQAVLDSGIEVTGCTLHYVDEGVDTGEILMQKKLFVEKSDTVETLKNKVQRLEQECFVEFIKRYKKQETNKYQILHTNIFYNSKTMNTNITQIKRALISVFNKDGVVELAKGLSNMGVEILSTGGTAKKIRESGIPVIDVSDFTGFPEMMHGRVKTLNPLIHAGILGLRDEHATEANDNGIKWIDLVVCNLYPFVETIAKPGVTEEEIIENIDIGGPTMIRSAAKNIGWCSVVTEPDDYLPLLTEIMMNGGVCFETRKKLSIKAFGHTASYDSAIFEHFNHSSPVIARNGAERSDAAIPLNAAETTGLPHSFQSLAMTDSMRLTLSFTKHQELRYGENPHQEAAVYKLADDSGCNVLNAKILQGKQLSYNNIGDADGALAMIKEFSEPTCVVVKHANPCGVATDLDITKAFKRAYAADSLSAFGGIIALNRSCTIEIAKEIVSVYAEIVLAPSFEFGTLDILAKKKNMRVLELGEITARNIKKEFTYIDGGALIQDVDVKTITLEDLKFVTDRKPNEQEIADMLFGWKVLKHVKSNGILIAKNNTTVGIGAGQMSRVDAVELAIKKGGKDVRGSILASDAFFPFRDSIDMLVAAGIRAVIQPGGSIRDKEVITAADQYRIAMVFTGARCFKH